MSSAAVLGRDVVRVLFGDCVHPVEFRALRIGRSAFFQVDDYVGMYRFCQEHASADLGIFWGVATRDGDGRGLRHCRELPALFIDADLLDEVRLHRFPFRPTCVVASGRPKGAHVYWKLKEPLDLQVDVERASGLLRRLAFCLDADMSAAEPARVLRVVGTRNPKYVRAPLVSVQGLSPRTSTTRPTSTHGCPTCRRHKNPSWSTCRSQSRPIATSICIGTGAA